MTNQKSPKEDINKLIEFRQAIYENALLARRDALFDLLDALICERTVSSFGRLSQSTQFQRKWPSLYAAVEDGEIDCHWLRTYLALQVPQQGICVFPLDDLPGAPDCVRCTTSVAETTATPDITAGPAEPAADFCTDWLSGSPTENARKSIRMAAREAKDTEKTARRRQKDACCGSNGLKLDW